MKAVLIKYETACGCVAWDTAEPGPTSPHLTRAVMQTPRTLFAVGAAAPPNSEIVQRQFDYYGTWETDERQPTEIRVYRERV